MARIAGVDLPRDKRVEIGLTYIYGIGPTLSKEILSKAGIDADIRVRDLSEDDVAKIRGVLADYKVEGDLRREESLNIKRLVEIEADVIVQDSRLVDSAQRPMLVPVKVRRRPSQAKRLRLRNNVEGGITWLR